MARPIENVTNSSFRICHLIGRDIVSYGMHNLECVWEDA